MTCLIKMLYLNLRMITPYIIPEEVFNDVEICSTSKLLYSLIMNLSLKDGFCIESNSYLAEKLNVKKGRISELIQELIKSNYVESEHVYREYSKSIMYRKLTPIKHFSEVKLINELYNDYLPF
jgi:DNA-binding MarR family transcriptional regulator